MKLLSHWLVGTLIWSLLVALVLGLALGVGYGVKLFIERADWKLIKSLITWAVWMYLLISVSRLLNAKARKL